MTNWELRLSHVQCVVIQPENYEPDSECEKKDKPLVKIVFDIIVQENGELFKRWVNLSTPNA